LLPSHFKNYCFRGISLSVVATGERLDHSHSKYVGHRKKEREKKKKKNKERKNQEILMPLQGTELQTSNSDCIS
jgi:hypothetical protein